MTDLQLARAAAAAYDQQPALPGYTTWAWRRDSTEVFAFISDTDIIIAFRGTDSLGDWGLDARIWRTRVAGLPGTWHRGFVRALEPVHHQLLSFLEFNLRGRRLSITGHSLGGALAVLFAARLGHGTVVTLGAPRVASVLAAQATNKRLTVRRYEHRGDRVPHLPWAAAGYRHIGERIVLGKRARRWWHRIPVWLSYPIRAKLAHSITRYLNRIEERG